MVELLLEHNAIVDVPDGVTGKTALIKASYVGHAEVCVALLQAGAEIDLADSQGYTALAFGTSFNHSSVIVTLLQAKANPNVQDEFGISPLVHSAARGHGDAVVALLQAGAKPELEDFEGKTALDYAASAGFDDIARTLAQHSAALSQFSSSIEQLTYRESAQSSRATTRSATDTETSLTSRGVGAMPAVTARGSMPDAARLTPRVPRSGEIKGSGGKTTRRHMGNDAAVAASAHAHASQASRRAGNRQNIFRGPAVDPRAVGKLETERFRYLTRKLVSLSWLLEQDTILDDARYPTFY